MKKITLIVLALGFAFAVTSCRDTEKTAGESLDETIDAIENTAEDVKETFEEAAEDVEEAFEGDEEKLPETE